MATRHYTTFRAPGYNASMLHVASRESGSIVWDDARDHGGRVWTWLMHTSKAIGGNLNPYIEVGEQLDTPVSYRFGRWVTNPLEAQTISGTLDVGILGQFSSAGSAVHWRIYAYVTVGDTEAVRGELLDWTDPVAWSGPGATNSGRGFSSAQSLASVDAQAGDRVMIEIGPYFANALPYNGTTVFHTTARMYGGTQNGFPVGSSEYADVIVGSAVGAAGWFDWSHTFVELAGANPAPPNDDCADATVITELPYEAEINTIGSTDPAGHSVWFRWTADETGPVDFIALGSNHGVLFTIRNWEAVCPPVSAAGIDFVEGTDSDQWTQNSTSHQGWVATEGNTYSIQVQSVQFSTTWGAAQGGFLKLQFFKSLPVQPGDVIVNAQVIVAYRDGVMINYLTKFYGNTPTGSSIDMTNAPIVDLNADQKTDPAHIDRRLAVVLFGFELVEYLDAATLNQGEFETTFLDMDEGIGFAGEHPASIVWDAAGSIYVGFFGDNYDHIGVPPSNPATGYVYKFAGNITDTNSTWTPAEPEAVLQAIYEVEFENSGSDYIELSSDQRTLFYTSAGQRVLRYDTVADAQMADFASAVPLPSGPREGLRGMRLLPPGDGTYGLLVAAGTQVLRLDRNGNVIQTYSPEPAQFAQDLDKIELTPNAEAFYVTDQLSTYMFQFDIESGEQLGTLATNLPNGQLCGFSSYLGYRPGTDEPPVREPPVPSGPNCPPCPTGNDPPSPDPGPTPEPDPEIIPIPESVCEGGGLVPLAADPEHCENWRFN